jgi:hypothetical protein
MLDETTPEFKEKRKYEFFVLFFCNPTSYPNEQGLGKLGSDLKKKNVKRVCVRVFVVRVWRNSVYVLFFTRIVVVSGSLRNGIVRRKK